MEKFRELLNQKVYKLFLIVWPPLGEVNESDIDMSFGIVFLNRPNRLCIISTNKEDMWTPYIRFEDLPNKIYCWSDFLYRKKNWMKYEENDNIIDEIEAEYYDLTECNLFKNIITSRINAIELIRIENISEPFGVKILFTNDYILTTPISDGNTAETSKFNNNNNIAIFEKLGKLVIENIT